MFTKTEKTEMAFIKTAGSGGKNSVFDLALDVLNMRCPLEIQMKLLNRQLDICVKNSGGKFRLNVHITGI